MKCSCEVPSLVSTEFLGKEYMLVFMYFLEEKQKRRRISGDECVEGLVCILGVCIYK